jgi:hypothetical protein
MAWNLLRRFPPFKTLDRAFWRVRSVPARGAYRGKTGLRLHLGCGVQRLEGYVNIDADPSARADVFLDFKDLRFCFRGGSAREILMIHSIAYLNLWQARDLFLQFRTLLAPGGKLVLETPDLEKCVAKIREAGEERSFNPAYLEGVRGLYAFGLEQMEAKRDYRPYAFGWAAWHLKEELETAGFRDVRILEPLTHEPWRDVRVEALNPG